MTCSTCDGYEFVPSDPDDPASLLVSCPDCPPVKLRCPVHGRIVRRGQSCCECIGEAHHALELLADLSVGRASRPLERSVAA